jgi:hypothetical protein
MDEEEKEVKSYIHHRLLIINEQVDKNSNDDTFMRCMQISFDWANRMGLEGKRVWRLHLQEPDPNDYNPLAQHKSLWCMIECTIEERTRWEEINKLNIEHAVYDMLKDN